MLANDVIEAQATLPCACSDPAILTGRNVGVEFCPFLCPFEQLRPEMLPQVVAFGQFLLCFADLTPFLARPDDQSQQWCWCRVVDADTLDLEQIERRERRLIEPSDCGDVFGSWLCHD